METHHRFEKRTKEEGNCLTQDQILRAVSFYTSEMNTPYEVYVITDYKDPSSFEKSRTLVSSGTMEKMGYHTVTLANPIDLKAGTRFAVILNFEKPDEYGYACEMMREVTVDGKTQILYSRAKANRGESFCLYQGSWQDITVGVPTANWCIKAFTDNGKAEESDVLYEGIDNENRPCLSETDIGHSEEIWQVQEEEVSEEYIQWRRYRERLAEAGMLEETEEGSIPVLFELGKDTDQVRAASSFPASYSLCDDAFVTHVRNQADWSVCWAFAAYGSLESCA